MTNYVMAYLVVRQVWIHIYSPVIMRDLSPVFYTLLVVPGLAKRYKQAMDCHLARARRTVPLTPTSVFGEHGCSPKRDSQKTYQHKLSINLGFFTLDETTFQK